MSRPKIPTGKIIENLDAVCVSAFLLLWLAACSFFKPQEHFAASEISFDKLSGWADDDHAAAALENICRQL